MTLDPSILYKLIVLYILDKANFKLTYAQLSSFILEREYTNFFTLQQVISDLEESELIQSDTLTNRTLFTITDEGRKTLTFFKNRIGEDITVEIDNFLTEKRMDLKSEAAITATCYKTVNNAYEVVLAAKEKDSDLVNIKLSVPFKDMAEAICDNWYQKNQQIYQYLMGELI